MLTSILAEPALADGVGSILRSAPSQAEGFRNLNYREKRLMIISNNRRRAELSSDDRELRRY